RRAQTPGKASTVFDLVPGIAHKTTYGESTMQYFVNGAKYSFSTTLALAAAITAITNAEQAVATSVTPPQEGDIVLLSSNWTELNEVATFADAVAGDTFTLANIDTRDTGLYPAGEGAPANYRVAGTFVSLSQIRSIDQSGGDENSFDFGY